MVLRYPVKRIVLRAQQEANRQIKQQKNNQKLILARKKGKTPQIPCVSVFCNPRTVEPTHTFQEQLIVVKN